MSCSHPGRLLPVQRFALHHYQQQLLRSVLVLLYGLLCLGVYETVFPCLEWSSPARLKWQPQAQHTEGVLLGGRRAFNEELSNRRMQPTLECLFERTWLAYCNALPLPEK